MLGTSMKLTRANNRFKKSEGRSARWQPKKKTPKKDKYYISSAIQLNKLLK